MAGATPGGNAKAGAYAAASAMPLLVTAEVAASDPDPLARLAEGLGDTRFAMVILFVSNSADLDALTARLPQVFVGVPVIGCTTAGEISRDGYDHETIVAVGLPARDFAVETIVLPDLTTLDPMSLVGQLIRSRSALALRRPDWPSEFVFLLVDGLSVKEDELTAALASGLGPVPLFGGSAGDGTRFKATHVLAGGQKMRNAAVLAFVRTRCPIKVFSLDHLVPTERRMVVTEADPRNRTVSQINAEPAAREFARLVGKDPEQLTTFTFAAHPVAVRLGGKHHVRAIQQVAENGDLVFFSAIDEGLVLTLAEPMNMVRHLEAELGALAHPTPPEAILACDCILRRMEAEQKQMTGQISTLLRRHRVIGFSTYGEQMNAMHVNQTMTGVAFYRPEGDADE